MRWSAIQGNWHGLMMNLGGILDYDSADPVCVDVADQEEVIQEHHDATEEMHARFHNQDEAIDYCLRAVDECRHDMDEIRREFETPEQKNSVHYPDSPEKALKCIPYRCTEGSNGMKRQRLTDRFAELDEKDEKEEKEWSNDVVVEISGSEEEEEEDYEEEESQEESQEEESQEEEEEEEDSDYLELRSGTKYYK
jgi:membrane-associated HD superfamily phosphohydrolase